ncbi:MAG: UDP-glucose 6-dehydrogenase [Phycisphaeraceae bacterium]|nr:UDP-glucose 6-dehydrogenase [Phycisphaeraceae bacterium]
MRISVIGTGYVGLVTGTCFANTGNDVICLDIDQEKIDQLRDGRSPIYEPGLGELITRNIKARRLHFSTDKKAAYEHAEVIFICVGTPSDNRGQADLKYILGAATDIGQAMESAPGKTGGHHEERRAKIIVVKSTVPVGTNTKVQAEIPRHTRKTFRMASNPEFLKEGAAISDFNKPDRVVVGVDDKGTGDRLRDLYEPFVRQGNPIFIMDILSAEMVKYASNAMLATKISFINEIANLCEAFGADIDEVRRGMCADSRIGNQFYYPGLGYGGSCFPKDVLAMISMGEQADAEAQLLTSVHQVNQRQRSEFIRKIEHHFSSSMKTTTGPRIRPVRTSPTPTGQTPVDGQSLKGKRFAIWGIAFKAGTDDIREAPSMTIMQHLLSCGATVVAHDPVAHTSCQKALGDTIYYRDSALDALDDADALIICTDWDEFRHPDFEEIASRMKQPVIFDGRNLYRLETVQEYGLTYYSIGRDPFFPQSSSKLKTA